MAKKSTALVTGAARRLGRAIALDLAEQGIGIVAHYGRSQAEAEALVREIRGRGREAWAIRADLADPAEAGALFARSCDLAGPIDVLVNNASIFPGDRLLDFDKADLDRNIQVNAFAPLLLARAFAAGGGRGVIINLLDSRIHAYDRDHAAYHLSKRMLFSLTRLLAVELAPAIRVNGVAPGLILPPPGEDESYLQRMKHTNPLESHGGAGDVARAVRFLIDSGFVTGQVIYVDGGRHLNQALYG